MKFHHHHHLSVGLTSPSPDRYSGRRELSIAIKWVTGICSIEKEVKKIKQCMCHELCFFSCFPLQYVPFVLQAAPHVPSSLSLIMYFCFWFICSALVYFFLSFVSLLTRGLCMVPIKGPAVPVPDDAIMASCVGTAFCAALQCNCLGLFGPLD